MWSKVNLVIYNLYNNLLYPNYGTNIGHPVYTNLNILNPSTTVNTLRTCMVINIFSLTLYYLISISMIMISGIGALYVVISSLFNLSITYSKYLIYENIYLRHVCSSSMSSLVCNMNLILIYLVVIESLISPNIYNKKQLIKQLVGLELNSYQYLELNTLYTNIYHLETIIRTITKISNKILNKNSNIQSKSHDMVMNSMLVFRSCNYKVIGCYYLLCIWLMNLIGI